MAFGGSWMPTLGLMSIYFHEIFVFGWFRNRLTNGLITTR